MSSLQTLRSLEWGLQHLSILTTGLLAVRLLTQGLHRNYRWFFAYLVFDFIRSAAGLAIPVRSNGYLLYFSIATAVSWPLYFLLLLEIYRLVLQDHPGIATLGKWTVTVAFGVAAVFSVILLPLDLANPAEKYAEVRSVLTVHRAVSTALVVLLVLISAFLAWFPVRLCRNRMLYGIGFSIYFLSATGVLLLRNLLGHQAGTAASVVYLTVSNLCVLLWVVFLNKTGEQRTAAIGHSWNRPKAERLLRQLDTINSALARAKGLP